jgi:hypothetical protein
MHFRNVSQRDASRAYAFIECMAAAWLDFAAASIISLSHFSRNASIASVDIEPQQTKELTDPRMVSSCYLGGRALPRRRSVLIPT